MMPITLSCLLLGCSPSPTSAQICENYVDTPLYESCMCLDAHQRYFDAVAKGCCDDAYRQAMQAACDAERERDAYRDSGSEHPGPGADTGYMPDPACEWVTSCSSFSCEEPTCDPDPPADGDK